MRLGLGRLFRRRLLRLQLRRVVSSLDLKCRCHILNRRRRVRIQTRHWQLGLLVHLMALECRLKLHLLLRVQRPEELLPLSRGL